VVELGIRTSLHVLGRLPKTGSRYHHRDAEDGHADCDRTPFRHHATLRVTARGAGTRTKTHVGTIEIEGPIADSENHQIPRAHTGRFRMRKVRPMRFFHRTQSSGSVRARKARAVAGLVLAASAGTVGLMATTATAAHADPLAFHPIISNSSWLDVAVRNGSSAPGTDIIQWWSDNGSEQQWAIMGNQIVNENSRMCLTTDGVAGDALTQEPCSSDPHQVWWPSYVWWAGGNNLYNPASGLDMDVAGNSYWGGAEIDAWYPNGQLNQVFSMPGQPGM
jgi:hypothetical protein